MVFIRVPTRRYIGLWMLLLCTILCNAEPLRTGLSGRVVDAQTGQGLSGVELFFTIGIYDEPTLIGTTSDKEGYFSLSNTENLTSITYQMVGYETDEYPLVLGVMKENVVLRLRPSIINLQEINVRKGHEKRNYRRKDNPAVAFMRQVIAHKDSMTVKTMPHYVVDEYSRTSFSLNDFRPNFEKGFWKGYECVRKYIDTSNALRPSLTVSMRECLSHRYFQSIPKQEKIVVDRKRCYGIEDMFTTQALSTSVDNIFKPIELNDNDITLLFNRFVSPLSSTIAISYYQYYLQDTLVIDGDSCVDVAFIPVNSESYSFTGHLYVLNDGSYKIKKYILQVPQHISLNFVNMVEITHTYRRLSNGLWANDRTHILTDFYVFKRTKNITGRYTHVYGTYDFEQPINKDVFTRTLASDTLGRKDSLTFRERMALWDALRPEPLSEHEIAILDLLEECKHLPQFNSLIMFCDAISSRYVATTPSYRWGESKWDFGPIFNMFSWNILEGFRFRLGGMTTARANPHLFFKGYVAFSTKDLLPKGNATIIYSFNKKKYQPFEPWRHYISVMGQYDVEETGAAEGWLGRDNIFRSVPLMKPKMKNFEYVARARVEYMKEWPSHFSVRARFDFENNKATGSLHYDRVTDYQGGQIFATQRMDAYNNYEGEVQLLYMPGGSFPVSREGVDTQFTLEKDGPVVSLTHQMGYLDDRQSGGEGFYYNHTEIGVAKRFWFSSFGHLDTRLRVGYIWNKVPFMKLYTPTTSSIFILNDNGLNAMQPMEFMMDRYIDWSMTYYFKGWIFNRIPGINRLQLRGLVSFSGVYGYLGKRNNPYLEGNKGLYQFSDASKWTETGEYIEGYTSSPIGKLPYMELTVGLENIFKVVRIDYIRRLTYNEYELPIINPETDTPFVRKLPAWGRNGVKISFRFEF